MTFLEKFDNFCRRISDWFEWVGVAALLVMMSITSIDVVGAKVFGRPVYGAIDIVMLSQLVAMSFAIAAALILGRHIQVEFFFVMLPKRVQAVVDSIINLFGLLLFVLIIWRLCVLGYSYQTGGEWTATARIPLYPFAYSAAIASIPVCLIFILQFLQAMAKVVKR